MKKYLLLLVLLIASAQSFAQIPTPDGFVRPLLGNYNFIYSDSTGTDTIKIYPNHGIAVDTLYFQDGTKQYSAEFTGDLAVDGIVKINGLYYQSDSTTLADDASITFTAATYGWGEVYVFNSDSMVEWAEFIFNSDGTVTFKTTSFSVANTDTDNMFCIYDAGSQFAIRNRLGGNRTVKYIIHH